jgi:hypothetical protein
LSAGALKSAGETYTSGVGARSACPHLKREDRFSDMIVRNKWGA